MYQAAGLGPDQIRWVHGEAQGGESSRLVCGCHYRDCAFSCGGIIRTAVLSTADDRHRFRGNHRWFTFLDDKSMANGT